MSDWAAKRFWTDVAKEEIADGFVIKLDGRLVKTPAKATLLLPTEAMADAVVLEWAAQEGKIDPNTMPVTRSANASVDKVAVQEGEVVAMLADYGDADLICYRATEPQTLVARQSEGWDPMITWAADELGAVLKPRPGVMHEPQAPDSLAALKSHLEKLGPFHLTAMHDLVSITGSLVLGLAVGKFRLTGTEAWSLSRIDDDWQIEQWGEDEEAAFQAEQKRLSLLHAERFLELSS